MVWIAVLTTALPVAPMRVVAAERYLDAVDLNPANNNLITGSGLGGTAVWNTSTANWWNGASLSLQPWSNAAGDTPVFHGTGGTVTLAEAMTVGGLSFYSTRYTLTGSTIQLVPGSTIALNDAVGVTVDSVLQGTGGFTLANPASGGRVASIFGLRSESSALTGSVTIGNGTTLLMSGAGELGGAGQFRLNGGNLTLDNSTAAGGNNTNRIGNATAIVVNGNSQLTFIHNSLAGTHYSETVGDVQLQSGYLTYTGSIGANATTGTSIVTAGDLVRTGSTNTATVQFNGTSLGADARNRLLFSGGVTAGQDLGPWALYGATRFAAYNATNGVVASTTSNLAVGSNNANANFTTTVSVTLNPGVDPSFKTLGITGTTARTVNLNGNLVSVGGLLAQGQAHVFSNGSIQAPADNAPLYFFATSSAPIVSANIVNRATGSNALVMSGIGTLTLSGTANDYKGGTIINSGTISINNDARLGDSDGDVTFNGSGGLSFSATVTLNAGRTITLNNGSLATLSGGNVAGHDIQGPITGNGGLVIAGGGTTHTQFLSNPTNDYTGPTTIGTGLNTILIVTGSSGSGLTTVNNLGTYRLQGAGLNNGAIQVNPGGTLAIDNSVAVGGIVNDRLNGQDVALGGTFNYTGGPGANSDQVGQLNLFAQSSITLTQNTAGPTAVNVDTLTRQAGATLVLTGRLTGAAPGANVTNLVVAANGDGAGAIGGTGLAGSTSMSINPYAVGTDNFFTGNPRLGFVTNQINGAMLTDGFRNLAFTEYATSITDGAVGFDNVDLARVVGGLNSPATQINSLRLDTGGGVAGSGTLTVHSGAILALGGNRGIETGVLSFGSQEAVFHVLGESLVVSAAVAGSGGLTKAGAGLLQLNGANTYTGNTYVNAGIVRLGAAGALDSNGAVIVNFPANTMLDLDGFDQTIGSLAGVGTSGGLVRLGGATLTTGGDDSSTVFNGVIFGTGGLTKNGDGTMQLGAANTYDGTTQVNNGTLRLGIANALPAGTAVEIAAGGTLDLAGIAATAGKLEGSGTVTNSGATVALTVGGGNGVNPSSTFNGLLLQSPVTAQSPLAGSLSLTKIGAGTITLAPSGAVGGDAAGTLTVTAGTLEFSFDASSSLTSGIVGPMATTLNGGTIQITGRNGGPAVTQTLGALTVAAGGGVVKADANGGTANLTFASVAATTAGGTLLIDSPSDTSIRLGTAITAATPNGRLVFTDGTGFDWATNGNVAGSPMTGGVTYTDVSGATIPAATVNANNALIVVPDTGLGEVTTAAGAWQTHTLKIDATAASATGGVLTLNGNLSLDATGNGAILFTGAHDYTIGGSGLVNSQIATNSDVIIHTFGAGKLLLNAAVGSGTGAQTLTKGGSGTLVLGASANLFTGGVFINGGVLSVSSPDHLGNAAASTAITIGDGATFQTTASMTILGGTVAKSHSFALAGGVATIDVANSNTTTLGGIISGVGGLKVTRSGTGSTGTLVLAAANTFSGGLEIAAGATVEGGIANFLNANTGGTAEVDGTLDLNGFAAVVGGISGAGTITNGGAAAVLTVGGNELSTVFSGSIGGAVGLSKTGNGTLQLTGGGNVNYSGSTTVTNGTLRLSSGASIGNAPVTIGLGAAARTAVLDLNGASQSITTLTFFGSGTTGVAYGVLDLGPGATLDLGGDVTVNNTGNNLGALITGGTLSLNATGRVFNVVDSTGAFDELTVASVVTGGGLAKSGSGALFLTGANTFTGGISVAAGTLRFTTVSDNGGPASSLGQGTDGITLGAGTLAFAGTTDQATNRAITVNGSTLNASGGGAKITFNGAITGTGSITLDGTGEGTINAGWVLTGTDLTANKNGGGTWNINAPTNTTGAGDWNINAGVVNANVTNALNAADNIIIDGLGVQDSAVVNISGDAGIGGVHQGNGIYVRNGGRINVNVSNGITNTGSGNGSSALNIGDSASVGDNGAGRLNLVGGVDIAVAGALNLGGAGGNVGKITGSGSIDATSYSFRGGLIESGITLNNTGAITKVGEGTVTFAGNRSSAGAVLLQEGTLVLDYSANNNTRLGAAFTLGNTTVPSTAITNPERTLTVVGNASAPTADGFTGTTIISGKSTIAVNNGTGQTATLALGTLTRTAVGGTVAFEYSSSDAVATITAATPLGWATVALGGTTRLADVRDGNVVQATDLLQNAAPLWLSGESIVNTGAYSGTVNDMQIQGLTFDAAADSTVTIAAGRRLELSGGGILVNAGVGAHDSIITGGSLLGSTVGVAGEIVVHQHNTAGSLTIASNIVNSAGITKTGDGELILSGNNTFLATSTLTINEGTVTVTGGNALADNATVIVRSGATFNVAAGSETVGSLGVATAFLAEGNVNIAAGASLTLNQAAAVTYFGTFTGAGDLTKAGAAVLTLNTDSSLTGELTVSGGQIVLAAPGGRFDNVSAIYLRGGSLHSTQTSPVTDRIADSAPITLYNTAGTLGLAADNTNTGNLADENIGALTLGAGHNVVTLHVTDNAAGATTALTADTLTRQNRSTLLVRGSFLGGAGGVAPGRGLLRFDADAQATVDGYEVGGDGVAGSQNINIIPWIIGDASAVTAHTATSTQGNTLVTNVSNSLGLRALTASEYTTDAAGFNALPALAASTNNVRFAANPGAALTGTATAINSLVIDSGSAVALTGPASAIEITSGAILAAGAAGHSLGGFTGVSTGDGRDYTVFVTAAAGGLTINSQLTSTVPLVKAGAGTLTLNHASNAFTDLQINQGTVVADDIGALGTGSIQLYGGTLRFDATFDGTTAITKAINVNTGGGALDVASVTSGVTLAGGLDTTLSPTDSAGEFLTLVTRATGVTGNGGQLTIGGSSAFRGTTVVNHTGLNSGVTNSVILNGTTNQTINGDLQIGNRGAISNNNFDVVVALGAGEQIVDTATIYFNGTSGENPYFKLMGFTETVAGIADVSGQGIIQNRESTETAGTSGHLILKSDLDFSFNGVIRNQGSGSGTTLSVSKQGSGMQQLTGASNAYTGATTISGGVLSVNTLANGGSNSGIGASTSVAGNLVLDGGMLRYAGTAAATTNRLFTLGVDGGGILNDGTNTVNFSGTGAVVFSGDGDRTFTLGGSHVGNNLFTPVLGDEAGNATTLIKTGGGTWVLAAAAGNSYSGGTQILGGTLAVNADNKLGNLAGDILLNGGTLRAASTFTLNASRTVSIGRPTGEGWGGIDVTSGSTLTVAGTIANNGSGTGTLVKTGDGTLVVTGAMSQSKTEVRGGMLQMGSGSAILNDATVRMNGMFIIAGDGDGDLINGNGPGAVQGTLSVEAGGVFSPGSSPGYTLVSNYQQAAGGTFLFEINDALGTAGPAPGGNGWDLLEVTNVLDLGSAESPVTSANRILIDFQTWQPASPGPAGPGDMVNWTPIPGIPDITDLDFTNEWRFLTFGTLRINGVAWTQDGWLSDLFTVDTTGFTNPGLVGGFGVYKLGNSLYFAATPEPSTLVIWSLFGAGACLLRRRRKTSASPQPAGSIAAA